VKRAWAIDGLLEECTGKIETNLQRIRKNATVLLDQLCHTPVMRISDIVELIGGVYNTAQKLVNAFVKLGILEQSEQQRNKTYRFRKYLDILEKEFTG